MGADSPEVDEEIQKRLVIDPEPDAEIQKRLVIDPEPEAPRLDVGRAPPPGVSLPGEWQPDGTFLVSTTDPQGDAIEARFDVEGKPIDSEELAEWKAGTQASGQSAPSAKEEFLGAQAAFAKGWLKAIPGAHDLIERGSGVERAARALVKPGTESAAEAYAKGKADAAKTIAEQSELHPVASFAGSVGANVAMNAVPATRMGRVLLQAGLGGANVLADADETGAGVGDVALGAGIGALAQGIGEGAGAALNKVAGTFAKKGGDAAKTLAEQQLARETASQASALIPGWSEAVAPLTKGFVATWAPQFAKAAGWSLAAGAAGYLAGDLVDSVLPKEAQGMAKYFGAALLGGGAASSGVGAVLKRFIADPQVISAVAPVIASGLQNAARSTAVGVAPLTAPWVTEKVLGPPNVAAEQLTSETGLKNLVSPVKNEETAPSAPQGALDSAITGTIGNTLLAAALDKQDQQLKRDIKSLFSAEAGASPSGTVWSLPADVHELASNPEALLTRTAAKTKAISSFAPTVAAEMTATASRAVAYLARISAQPPKAGPLGQEWTQSQGEKRGIAVATEVVMEPMRVLQHAKQGTLTSEQMTALREVYPALSNQIQMAALEQVAESTKAVPYSKRLMLSLLTGEDLDGSIGSIARNQAAIAARQAKEPQPQPSGSTSQMQYSERMSEV